MKNVFLNAVAICSLCLCFACNNQDETPPGVPTDPEGGEVLDTSQFAADDGSLPLGGTTIEQARTVLENVDTDKALLLGKTVITDEQYREIGEFVSKELTVEGDAGQTYRNIFNWIYKNIKYEYGDNDPYAVFTNRKAICQGYANLLKVMCISQGIPAVVANGYLRQSGYGAMGHAWNYVFIGGKWQVSDPTNNDVANASLYPSDLDVPVHEDEDFVYRYQNEQLNISEVKRNAATVVLPFSVKGMQITSFNPTAALPTNVREVYAGKNIRSLGSSDNMGLNIYQAPLERLHVHPDNEYLENYHGVIYQKDDKTPYYIPRRVEKIELKAVDVVGKNFVCDLPLLREITFGKGTLAIDNYAVENCPSLVKAILPATVVEVAEDAFVGVSDKFEAVYD